MNGVRRASGGHRGGRGTFYECLPGVDLQGGNAPTEA